MLVNHTGSTIWMGDIAAETPEGRLLVDISSFLTRDELNMIQQPNLAAGIDSDRIPAFERRIRNHILFRIPGVGSLEQRAKGFKEELATRYPGLKLVADKVADGMATTALNIMTDLITSNPDLRGVFASNLIMSQGAGQAIAENRIADKIKLVGFDSDDKLVKLLKDGNIAALIVQDPYRMGYDGVKTALADKYELLAREIGRRSVGSRRA